MNNSKPVKLKSNIMNSFKISLLACAIVMSGTVAFALQAAPEAKKDATASAQSNQKQFNTPKEAADSLI